MVKFNQETCEVCHEPIGNVAALPPEIQEKVYRPEKDESYSVELDLNGNGKEIFGEEDVDVNEFD